MEEEYGKKIDQKDKEVRDLERGCAEMRTRRIELLGRFNAKKRDVWLILNIDVGKRQNE